MGHANPPSIVALDHLSPERFSFFFLAPSPPLKKMHSRAEVTEVYETPLLDLVFAAARAHRMHNEPSMVQRCTLLSIKTGGCPEDCGYCSQSSHHKKVDLKAEKLMELEEVYEAAVRAAQSGSTRFCMGAAWRGPSQVGPRQWGRVLEMVTRIRGLGMEVCTTLGMLTPEQVRRERGGEGGKGERGGEGGKGERDGEMEKLGGRGA